MIAHHVYVSACIHAQVYVDCRCARTRSAYMNKHDIERGRADAYMPTHLRRKAHAYLDMIWKGACSAACVRAHTVKPHAEFKERAHAPVHASARVADLPMLLHV